jgi:hypothetical protein
VNLGTNSRVKIIEQPEKQVATSLSISALLVSASDTGNIGGQVGIDLYFQPIAKL